jgi:hypothetical protein
MITVIILEKDGSVNEKKIKNTEKLYSVCNYRSAEQFEQLYVWVNDTTQYELYGKKNGKANNENKFDLPPPVDSDLFFGTLCVLKKEYDNYVDFTVSEWNTFYTTLFGGFEDIETSDHETDTESEISVEENKGLSDDKELTMEDYEDED